MTPSEGQEWTDRFYREIGKLFFNSLSTALLMRHTNPLNTLCDYFRGPETGGDGSPESAGKLFVRGFVRLCRSGRGLKEFAQRWTGYEEPGDEAAKRISDEVDRQVAAIRNKGRGVRS